MKVIVFPHVCFGKEYHGIGIFSIKTTMGEWGSNKRKASDPNSSSFFSRPQSPRISPKEVHQLVSFKKWCYIKLHAEEGLNLRRTKLIHSRRRPEKRDGCTLEYTQ